jgi:hypothetical protein
MGPRASRLIGSGVAKVERGITRSQIGEALTEAGVTHSRPDYKSQLSRPGLLAFVVVVSGLLVNIPLRLFS